MKHRHFLIFFLVALFVSAQSYAQLTKEEKKALKKELKQYKKWKPIEIKVLKEEADIQRTELRESEGQIATLNVKVDSLKEEITVKNKQIEEFKSGMQYAASGTETETGDGGTTETGTTETGTATQATKPKPTLQINPALSVNRGVVFKVQLGAYEYFNIIKKLSDEEGVIQELDNGLFKYVLGSYRELNGAKDLRNEVRKMGISDAWVVSYIDGKRVNIREALDAAQQQVKNTNIEEDIRAQANNKESPKRL